MSNFCVGTMTAAIGWEVQSPEEALSKHFTYWFAARRNQGKVMGNVPSFYYLFMKYSRTPDTLVEKCQQEFDSYLGELAKTRTVRIAFEYINNSKTLYKIQIDAQVIIDGAVYDLGRTIESTGEYYRILDNES